MLSFQRHPLCTSQVRGGNYAGALGKFSEIFRGAFEGKPHWGRFEHGDRKDLPADPEGKVGTPGNLLGGMGKGKAEFANPFDIHSGSVEEIWTGKRPF